MRGNDLLDLQDWLAYLEQSHPAVIQLGLERIKEVGERGNLLQFPFPVITVAGTNGKGSTVSALSTLLKQAGLNVGTYTSPHLLKFNERIQINGKCLSDEAICEAFKHIETLRLKTSLTFFEFTTLAAFFIFQQPIYALDVVILEVGLGGRLDAVNAVEANLAIITTIGYDHQEYLGDTLESIAHEKAGIFRSQIPIVLGKKAQISNLLEQALALGNPVVLEGEHFDYKNGLGSWHFNNEMIRLKPFYLPGTSVSLAMAAYTLLGGKYFSLPPLGEVVQALANLTMMGRYHQFIFDNNIKLIFDVGHNEQASQWLAYQLQETAKERKIIAVWASLSDKALSEIIRPMKEVISEWFVGELLGVKRAARAEMLFQALSWQGIENISKFSSMVGAFHGALNSAKAGDCIVIFGSFYTVSQVLEEFMVRNREFQDRVLFSATDDEKDFLKLPVC